MRVIHTVRETASDPAARCKPGTADIWAPWGSPKNGWFPEDVSGLGDYPKTATKGSFCVRAGDGTVLFSVGPEPRPFENLRAVDWERVAVDILQTK
eukprot:CAMPEP_0171306938 /NCGR_PEP_ID=MMETSP0816-20121228/16998_1 /TAXON_ID=420281 /ORGANISM="Proboscia inermis, Strain CCAP1064/1" /LENGTH=95 /DNA_ID=CAMNT_0011788851 /DNA_START=60 /DNA_END=348 /DNA_ORIENTATION=-